jgi:hypothetical protein
MMRLVLEASLSSRRYCSSCPFAFLADNIRLVKRFDAEWSRKCNIFIPQERMEGIAKKGPHTAMDLEGEHNADLL